LAANRPAPAPAENVWQHSFEDPKLDSLMSKALDNNFNLRQTVARLDQATLLRVSENHLGIVIAQALDAVDRAIGKRTRRLAHVALALPGRQNKRNCQGGVG
jgi:outer membrane protein TolC